MKRPLSQPSRIWLTGASSGIGEALAEQLIGLGHHLVVTGRRQEPLDALQARAPARVDTAAADTTRKEQLDQISPLLQQTPLDMAILNAGTCEYLDVAQFDSDLIARNINTNVIGTARAIEAALPGLRQARKEGRTATLVIVSSSAWWFPFARAEGYGASKAALSYLARSLRADLAAEGIGVVLVSPGFVKTPLTDQNDFPMPFLISASDAAKRMINGLKKGSHNIEFPKRFTWIVRLLGNLPEPMIDRLAASMSRNATQDPNAQ